MSGFTWPLDTPFTQEYPTRTASICAWMTMSMILRGETQFAEWISTTDVRATGVGPPAESEPGERCAPHVADDMMICHDGRARVCVCGRGTFTLSDLVLADVEDEAQGFSAGRAYSIVPYSPPPTYVVIFDSSTSGMPI